MITRGRILFCRIVAALVIGAAAVVWYMAIDREPPYEYIEGHVIPSEVPVGSQIAIHWHIKAKRFCPGWVERFIVDERRYIWRNLGSPVRANTERESHIVNTVELPKTLGPGLARYRARVCYQCNPMHKFFPLCVDPPELPFRIIP